MIQDMTKHIFGEIKECVGGGRGWGGDDNLFLKIVTGQ